MGREVTLGAEKHGSYCTSVWEKAVIGAIASVVEKVVEKVVSKSVRQCFS